MIRPLCRVAENGRRDAEKQPEGPGRSRRGGLSAQQNGPLTSKQIQIWIAPLTSSYTLEPGFAQAVEQVVEPGLAFV